VSSDLEAVGDAPGARHAALARRIVADVLMLPEAEVLPDRALVADLGAESIDFLDLVFRVEEALGRSVTPSDWQEFVFAELGHENLAHRITVDVIRRFVARHDTAT
jgi:acyl carrier protein